MKPSYKPRLLSVLLAAKLGVASSLLSGVAWSAEPRNFDIQAGELDTVLSQFALEAGIDFHLDSSLSQGLYSAGISGNYSPDHALDILLANTGLTAEPLLDGSYRLMSNTNDMALDVIDVEYSGNEVSRDEAGAFAVYDEDKSTVYVGKDEVERYKGKDAADLFKGMLNVYSGDARNGGGLDPSIRGIQGPGRVPLSIDGTEQALTVWRGYRGVSNRNYLDPNLIGGIQVVKGPSMTPNTHTSVGGGVLVSTISAQDILLKGESFGGELIIEGSDNAVDPKLPTLLTGQDYRDIPNFPDPQFAYGDPSLWKTMSNDRNNNPFSGEDFAYRLALALKKENYEILGAYAYRDKGNYFSGTEGADFYNQPNAPEFNMTKMNPRSLAKRQRPGYEVPNTSSELESFLFKGKFELANSQTLSVGARLTNATFGEIMSSRAGDISSDGKMAQWPLSEVEAQAYNIKYEWDPASELIDLESNLWTTYTISNTNSAGGFPNYANLISDAQEGASPILRNTAVANNRESRVGFDFSNKMALTDSLDFTFSGRYQFHKIRSDDKYNGTADGWKHWPRAGRRQEYQGQFSFDWRPVDFLKLNVGTSYKNYWSEDDFLNERAAIGDERFFADNAMNDGLFLEYKTVYSEAEIQALRDADRATYAGLFSNPTDLEAFLDFLESTYRQEQHVNRYEWLHDGNGKYRRANNICVNGELDKLPNYIAGTCRATGDFVNQRDKNVPTGKKKGNAWVPAFTATVYLSDVNRMYYRYSEEVRFPSMFESTLGFSANKNPYNDIKEEHAFSHELAYIHYFNHADVKLTYFHHKTKDVIERSGNLLRFYNIEQQTLEGLEFQGRYDNGRFFSDLSLSYMLNNEVCDESLAINADKVNGSIPNCVHAGFAGGYLTDQAIPEYSANLGIGGRFFNQSLETGMRSVFQPGSKAEEQLERDDALTFDAYAKYHWNDHLAFELVGTNLTDLYYIDPLVRSSVPAPGRTIKLKMQVKF